MARIQREWLSRIGGYAPGFRPVRRRGKPAPEGEEGVSEEEEALLEGEVPGEGEDASLADSAQEGGEPHEGRPSDRSDQEPEEQDQDPPAGEREEFGLDVPEEIEAQRREDETRKHRSVLNRDMAPQAFALEGHYLRNLATRFARMVSKVAEDSADLPMAGDDEWDYSELLRRRFTGRMIHQCRMTREKRKVAVVLDTSPSCEHQARLFGSIARIAEELGDCDLYDAPNFLIMAHKSGSDWTRLSEHERQWDFQGRVVLAFGDFDGIDKIAKASAVRGNKIYWFSCEERPQVLEMHREEFLKTYKGKYFPATNLGQLFKAMGRVR